jgi:nucleoside-diphosphate-sugar epimerase
MEAVVTGGAGFTGRHLVERLLNDGHKVCAIDLDSPNLEDLRSQGSEVLCCDLCLGHDLARHFYGKEVVFHVAALASPWGKRERFFSVNVKGTDNVIDACRKAGVRRLVAVSSTSAVFDGYTHHVNIDESFPYPKKFLSPYSETKSLAEQHVLAANGSCLETVVIRPHVIWGPRDRTFLARLCMHARSGPIMHIGGGLTRTDTTYVENLVDALLLGAESERAPGNAYFITNGESILYRDLINRLLDIMGLPRPRGSIPSRLAFAFGAICEGIWNMFSIKREPVLTRYKVAELAYTHTYNIDKARRDLGYKPRVSTEEGFSRLAAWVREEGLA